MSKRKVMRAFALMTVVSLGLAANGCVELVAMILGAVGAGLQAGGDPQGAQVGRGLSAASGTLMNMGGALGGGGLGGGMGGALDGLGAGKLVAPALPVDTLGVAEGAAQRDAIQAGTK